MAHRTVRYVPDGARVRALPAEVVAEWRERTSLVPAQFAVGTAQHESDFALNEVDVEVSGFTSVGIFQLSSGEAAEVGLAAEDLLSLRGSTAVFAALCERRLSALVAAARLDEAALPPDVWAYLALAHNQGLGAALKTVRVHGLDWAAYKARNQHLAASMGAYGDDVISGGREWPE